MPEPTRFELEKLQREAARGVLKIDQMGVRGATLVSCEEVTAMAVVIVMSGILPAHFLQPENVKRDRHDRL